MKKQQVHKFLAKTHKWIGLVLGLQVLAWTVGGVVMSWIPIDTVRGAHNVEEQSSIALMELNSFLPIAEIAKRVEGPITRATYMTLLERPVVRIIQAAEVVTLVDAQSGHVLPPVDERLARRSTHDRLSWPTSSLAGTIRGQGHNVNLCVASGGACSG